MLSALLVRGARDSKVLRNLVQVADATVPTERHDATDEPEMDVGGLPRLPHSPRHLGRIGTPRTEAALDAAARSARQLTLPVSLITVGPRLRAEPRISPRGPGGRFRAAPEDSHLSHPSH
jgi:hypothetical protein